VDGHAEEVLDFIKALWTQTLTTKR
jgi:hypothetical protein